jgi:hypothetical protein
MSPRRWRKPLPPPVVAEGQTTAFDADGLPVGEGKADTVYVCRECYSRRINPPIVPTVDPRWVIGTCLDCGTRQICTVVATPSRKENTEGEHQG